MENSKYLVLGTSTYFFTLTLKFKEMFDLNISENLNETLLFFTLKKLHTLCKQQSKKNNKSCVMNTTAGYVIIFIQNDIMTCKDVI